MGPLVHRIYRTRIVGSTLTAEDLMSRIAKDLDSVAPSEFATFQKLDGGADSLAAGDRYIVRMPGPWDGPVSVVEAGPTSFRLATLKGHLEAGQIEFRLGSDYRSLWFEIESWARSGDRLSDLLYSHLRISKEVQLHMWSSVLRQAAALAAGRLEGGIVVTTRVVGPEALPGGKKGGGGPPDLDPALLALAERDVNFDAAQIDAYLASDDWRVDDMIEPLPPEASGPAEEGGSWRTARELMIDYQLADPNVVSAAYDSAATLAGRDMLLTTRFWGLRFRVGVRVGDVYDETFVVDGREVQVFGWDYRTLEGHFEQGQMHYEVWKWTDTGEVEFHLRALSRPARKGALILGTGFRLFGRTQQLRFYRQSSRRIRRLTEAQLETDRANARR
ncbi:MAG: DUF1990 domain-containing protein [Gemmatimonadota bacterium]|nr:DUF1990 domain-containing protein [Gemmatimonadota bacterium]